MAKIDLPDHFYFLLQFWNLNFPFLPEESLEYMKKNSFNYDQLIDCGVSKDSILLDANCTFCNKSYFSFRREGDSAGRMVALAGWY